MTSSAARHSESGSDREDRNPVRAANPAEKRKSRGEPEGAAVPETVKPPGAREQEIEAVAEQPSKERLSFGASGEAMAMLARRGFRARIAGGGLPFPENLGTEAIERIAELLGHYAFRLFLRGAIQYPEGFLPGKTTRYLKESQATGYAELLAALGAAERLPGGRYRLPGPARSFGGTLEWYVARELDRRFGFDAVSGVKIDARGVGGDLDVVAAAEGKFVYLELKSSPPKNLSATEVSAFFDRLQMLRPDLSIFVVDTALRLTDKILPMLADEMRRRNRLPAPPLEVGREQWAVTPHLYAVNGRRDLMANIGRALAEGLRALSPDPF